MQHRQVETMELSTRSNNGGSDEKRMAEMGRRAPDAAPRRHDFRMKGVVGLATLVVVSWQNMVFLCSLALTNGGRAGFFWSTIVVFPIMFVVYFGFSEKAAM